MCWLFHCSAESASSTGEQITVLTHGTRLASNAVEDHGRVRAWRFLRVADSGESGYHSTGHLLIWFIFSVEPG